MVRLVLLVQMHKLRLAGVGYVFVKKVSCAALTFIHEMAGSAPD